MVQILWQLLEARMTKLSCGPQTQEKSAWNVQVYYDASHLLLFECDILYSSVQCQED